MKNNREGATALAALMLSASCAASGGWAERFAEGLGGGPHNGTFIEEIAVRGEAGMSAHHCVTGALTPDSPLWPAGLDANVGVVYLLAIENFDFDETLVARCYLRGVDNSLTSPTSVDSFDGGPDAPIASLHGPDSDRQLVIEFNPVGPEAHAAYGICAFSWPGIYKERSPIEAVELRLRP